MNNENKGNNIINIAAVTLKESYEGKVALEALKRVGNNKNIKGVVHEIMFKDKNNLKNLFSSTKTVLTSSTNAVRDDVIIKSAGKIIGRSQLKDTAGCINNTIRQVASGKYRGTVLMGTKETTDLFNKAANLKNVTQKMTSTGISSAETARIGSKALGTVPSCNSLIAGVKNSSYMGGAISGGVEAISSLSDLVDGKISGGEYVGKVAKETIGGGISSAAATTASSLATMGASSVITTLATTGVGSTVGATAIGAAAITAAPVAIGAVAAIGVGALVKDLFDEIFG